MLMSIFFASRSVSATAIVGVATAAGGCGRTAACSCAQPTMINGAIAHKTEHFKLQLWFFMVVAPLDRHQKS
jgi:hypothetical protein